VAERIHETGADVRTRGKATVALFVTAALMNAAMSAVSPAGMIYASGYLGVAWSAVPQCLTILGTGLGALLVARGSTRSGWRASLATAYGTATAGALLAFGATRVGSIPLLCLGMLLLGLGAGGAMIARYAAAELYPPRRQVTQGGEERQFDRLPRHHHELGLGVRRCHGLRPGHLRGGRIRFRHGPRGRPRMSVQVVDATVGGDPVEPGSEGRAALVGLPAPPGPQERLLHRVLRHPVIAQRTQGEAVQLRAMRLIGGTDPALV
jgi:hypothetical protein